MRWRSACQPKKSRLSCLSALMSIASNPFRYRRASNFERGFLVLAPIPRGPPRLQSHHRHGFARHPFAVYSSHERIEHVCNWHFCDMPTLLMNVGFRGQGGYRRDIAKPARLTHLCHAGLICCDAQRIHFPGVVECSSHPGGSL
jgi:hypothetical protein